MTNDELIQEARHKSLVDFFQASGYTLDKKGAQYYVTEINGLTINPNNNAWYHHYSGCGGYNAIDCVTKILGMKFEDAVYALTGQALEHRSTSQRKPERKPAPAPVQKAEPKPEQPKAVTMPEKAGAEAPLYAYLHKTRKIPYDVIREFISAGVLYQTNRKMDAGFKANAVFVHRDRNGNPVGGEIQGLDPVRRFKGMVEGTGDSVFHFIPRPSKDGKVKRAYVFESAIDLMSFYALFKDKLDLDGAAMISLAGLKPAVPKKLQAAGIEIISCVDNDDAGKKFEVDNGFKRTDFVKDQLDSKGLKDWNDLLKFPDARAAEPTVPRIVNTNSAVRRMG